MTRKEKNILWKLIDKCQDNDFDIEAHEELYRTIKLMIGWKRG